MRQNTPYILWWQYKVSRNGRKGGCQLLCIYIHPLFIRVKAPRRTAILKWRFHQSSLAKIDVLGKFNLFSIFIPLTSKNTILSHAVLKIVIRPDYNSSQTKLFKNELIHKDLSMFEDKCSKKSFSKRDETQQQYCYNDARIATDAYIFTELLVTKVIAMHGN